jgi:redox-sensing transcriptional repressor
VYLRVLGVAAEEGTATISSEDLAARAGVNAAQVRKDLSSLGSYGTRGVGYEVAYLIREISRQLGLSEQRRVAIVGVGNLGRALARYGGFSGRGFRIVAAFDTDPALIGQRLGMTPVWPVSELATVVDREQVDVIILTTPAQVAQDVADAVVQAGVRSILNFAPATLNVPPWVALRQVDLGVELQILSFYGQRAADRPNHTVGV